MKNKILITVSILLVSLLTFVSCSSTVIDETNTDNENTSYSMEQNNAFNFCVVDKDGNEKEIVLATDGSAKTVGEALENVGFISGDESEYGLYVTTVNGITADYNTDKAYWAFYINGELSNTGVDQTDIVYGSTYKFVYTIDK